MTSNDHPPTAPAVPTPKRHPWRAARRLLVVVGVAAAVGVGVWAANRAEPTAATPQAEVFKTEEVERGTLTTSERVDGRVERTDGLTVLHRIEGETASTSAPTDGGSNDTPQSGSSGPLGFAAIEEPTTTVDPADGSSAGGADPGSGTDPGGSAGGDTPGSGSQPGGSPSAPSRGTPSAAPRSTTAASAPQGTQSSARTTETITSAAAVGSKVDEGDVLYTVEGRPVVALIGELPAWRTLADGVDDGADVEQLEQALVRMGYDRDGSITVDQVFDDTTEAAVERWQAGLGLEATGSVELGAVVFVPEPTSISSVAVSVGDEVGEGDTVATLAATVRTVVIDVPDTALAVVEPGTEVRLGTAGRGTVSLLRSVDRDGTVVVQAVIVPDATVADIDDGGSVSVTIPVSSLPDVLIVPSEALLSRLDGTYGVQVKGPDGQPIWVTVEVLAVSGNRTAVSGAGLDAGTEVFLPV